MKEQLSNSLRAFVAFIITEDRLCNPTAHFLLLAKHLPIYQVLFPASLYHLFLPTAVYLWVFMPLISVHFLFPEHKPPFTFQESY